MSRLVLGLGNPGSQYSGTRHNLGFLVLDELVRRGGFPKAKREGPARVTTGRVGEAELVLGWPTTFMNLSGRAGAHLTGRLGIDPRDVIVVHDDLDLAVGRVQVKVGGGHAGQKGVLSLATAWRTKNFIRVRIGIGRPPEWVDPADYVLQPVARDDRDATGAAVARAADAVISLATVGLEATMNAVNRRS